MKITKEDAVMIAIPLGFRAAAKWEEVDFCENLGQLVDNLNDDVDLLLETGDVPDDDLDRLNGLLAGIIEDAGKIELVESYEDAEEPAQDAEEEDEAPEEDESSSEEPEAQETAESDEVEEGEQDPPKEDPPKEEKAEKPKEKPKKKEPVGKDHYGARLGTQGAQINASIDAGNDDLDKLVADTGMDRSRIRAHVKSLVKKGFFKRDDKKIVRVSKE